MTLRRDNEQTRAFFGSISLDLDPDLRIESPIAALALAEWNRLRATARWRLIGTHITRVVDRDSTGRCWDETYDAQTFAMLSRGPLCVMRHRRPIRVLGDAGHVAKGHVRSESVDMPLSHDGTSVHRVMTVTVYSVG